MERYDIVPILGNYNSYPNVVCSYVFMVLIRLISALYDTPEEKHSRLQYEKSSQS